MGLSDHRIEEVRYTGWSTRYEFPGIVLTCSCGWWSDRHLPDVVVGEYNRHLDTVQVMQTGERR